MQDLLINDLFDFALAKPAEGKTLSTHNKIIHNTINPVAKISHHGRRLRVTGPLATDIREKVWLRVTVTQRSTGALAEGVTKFTAAGNNITEQWSVRAKKRGHATFKPGPAVAVAVAVTRHHDKADDANQWLVNITLVDD